MFKAEVIEHPRRELRPFTMEDSSGTVKVYPPEGEQQLTVERALYLLEKAKLELQKEFM